jgi:ABC-2 type transport system permease protein
MLNNLLELGLYKELIKTLVSRDLKARYRNSVLGYAWTWLEPLMMMLIFIIIFDVLLKSGVEHFPVYLLIGLVPWTFFSNTLSASVGSITGNAGLIKRVYYPREIFPLTLILTHGVNMALSFLVLIPVILVFGVSITAKILLLPILTMLLFFFTFGLGLILATLNVFMRDIKHMVPLVIRVWFFATPIFYAVESRVPERVLDIYMILNPMAVILTLFRVAFMNYTPPKPLQIVVTSIICVLVFLVGYIFFKKNEDLMVKRI